MEEAYNNVFRGFLGKWQIFEWKLMFVDNRVDNSGAQIRRLMYGLGESLNVPGNNLVICLMVNLKWLSSEWRQIWENVYIYVVMN